MSIRILIVDDEPHAIAVIENYAKQVTGLTIAGTCRNAFEAIRQLEEDQVDLMFLDIKMPGMQGTELLKGLKDPPLVIFTTAYEMYAAQGFELDAVDYLMKPISRGRFLRAVEKAITIRRGQAAPLPDAFRTSLTVPTIEKHLYIRVERRTVKLKTADILWIESVKDYIRITLVDKVLVTKQKISVIEKLLPSGDFLRIHRSFIVPLSRIEAYHPNHLRIGEKELPVGRNYKQDLLKLFSHL
ncbi:LytR/AlgR family response regulator transcription factor [Pedobacter ginsengisoli]|uniref:LytR/AlgR family response regulator transcription factor n=1 Tax=Pedobacter ginsengisoli TaxID=363852 RepID=UPI002550C0D8|nr:LytTR family DNA-binding domain-containing protein [Pedobacter ginsengisoli]